MFPILSLIIPLLISTALIYKSRDHLNLVLMRFFRDMARFKARKRLYGNSQALIPILMGKEEPLDLSNLLELADAFRMTPAELARMDGEDGNPMYLAISGLIFDVTPGRKMYAPNKKYNYFIGKDCTLAIGKRCTSESCLDETGRVLNDKEHLEVQKWIEFYYTHDKYQLVGRLVDDTVEKMVEKELEENRLQEGDGDVIEESIEK